ncbi:MAG TPA: hypothetical protein VLK84_08895 [Longimicrobium sp.]|nr:hypothetical protein [Longimicrobium sp.]
MTDTLLAPTSAAPAPLLIRAAPVRDSSRDFHFLHGRWHVHNRRLLHPLTGSDAWIAFDGRSHVRPLWDGRANLETWEADAPAGRMQAVSLHLHDPRSGEWRLHWATRDSGRVGVPAIGTFAYGRGEFYAQEEFEGRTIFLRLVWEDRGPGACRFEQAFSEDGGRLWETNWTMDFTRLPDADDAPRDASAILRAPVARAGSGAHDFDFLHGTWRIQNRRLRDPLAGFGEWYAFDGSATELPLWDGDANLEEYEATLPGGHRIHGLALRLYEPDTRRWTIHWASSDRGRLDPALTGTFRDGVGEFISHEDYGGRMVLVRFHWTSVGPDAARWEQAFSADGGRTWETNWVMDFTRTGTAAAPPSSSSPAAVDDDAVDGAADDAVDGSDAASCCAVVELRQYLMHPRRRDELIELFDREFLETQEAAGMTVIAQFRDLDRPNVFTWFRGFSGMDPRAEALAAFYDGPVWARNRDAANATMVSSDDVLLLRSARPRSGFVPGGRAPAGAVETPPGIVVATIYPLREPAAAGFTDFFERTVAPRLAATGATPSAMLETEPGANTFPRLPVREGEHVFVWLARFADAAAQERAAAALARDLPWMLEVQPALERRLIASAEILRLGPTARSRTL